MTNRLSSDHELKEILRSFFQETENSKHLSIDEIKALFNYALKGNRGLIMREGQFFEQNEKTAKILHSLTQRCLKILGKTIGNEKDIVECAWKAAADLTAATTDEKIMNFLSTLGGKSLSSCTYIVPNYAVRFEDGITNLSIGRVRASLGSELAKEINNRNATPQWRAVVSTNDAVFSKSRDNVFDVPIREVCWSVDVDTSPGNVPEEALWLIDIALSLLRLSYPHKKEPFFPYIGETETSPTLPPQTQNTSLAFENDKWSMGGWRAPSFYTINSYVADHLIQTNFNERAHEVFFHSRRSLAERVAQGLGWLSRGRQAQDRSNRLLFFFTAIETLLSDSDRTAPITQTIIRYAAVLFHKDMDKRSEFAKHLQDLYETRSKLVHAGSREVSISDARTVQEIAEILYFIVLNKVDLSIKFTEFQSKLKIASYGSLFPFKETDGIKNAKELI